jgi:hypothetical protein
LLAAHDGYLHFLRKNALATAREWPSWDQSSLSMATALKRVADLPAGVEAAGIGRLTADVRAASEAWRRARRPDALPTHRFMRATPLQRVIATARRRRTVRVILRPFRPLIRRVLVPLIYR